jgi:hypothetical protein
VTHIRTDYDPTFAVEFTPAEMETITTNGERHYDAECRRVAATFRNRIALGNEYIALGNEFREFYLSRLWVQYILKILESVPDERVLPEQLRRLLNEDRA